MSSFPGGAGGDPWGEGFMPDSPLYLRTSILTPVCWREGGREGNTTHHLTHTHPTHKLYTPTTSNTSSDPTFQMGLSPASVKLLPGVACLHLNSLHTSWILSPLHSGLLTSETCFSGHWHCLIPNQPTTFHGLTSFALSRPVLPWFANLLPSFSFAVHCESPLLPFLSLLTLWYQVFLYWPLKMLPSLGHLVILTDSATTVQWRVHRLHAHPRSPPQTPDSYFQWPVGHLQLQDNWTTSGRARVANQQD